LTFEKPNLELFPNLRHAYDALSMGGNIPCVVNAANEICVAAFLKEQIKFTDMPKLIGRAMEQATYILTPTLEDYLETDREVRRMVEEWIK
jgi:1-deoxy-D-xylulose-5-phosphate reductoisomerase